MSHASTFGKMAEQKATEHLQSLGYQILARNFRWRSKEIDIIAQENETLVIVEVKARSSLYFGTPESFVSRRKITHLVEATNAYMDRHSLSFEVRFDIVSVFFSMDNGILSIFQTHFMCFNVVYITLCFKSLHLYSNKTNENHRI